jgi:hypothetical protein
MPQSEPSKELVVIDKDNLPETIDLLLSYPWPEQAQWLIKYGPDKEYDEQAKLLAERQAFQSLAAHCKSLKLADTATYAMMLGMAKKWGVVLDEDTDPFFVETISRAVVLPSGTELVNEGPLEDKGTELYSFMQLLGAKFTVEWVMEGILTRSGIISFSGPPGVGKTQIVIDWCISLATGTDFLGFKVIDSRPRKILFFSMEMIGEELKHFISKRAEVLTEDEKVLLEENFIFYPLGTPLYLNDPIDRAEYVRIIDEVKPEGIIIDSWSQAAKGNLSDDTVTRDAFAFVNFVRKNTGAFFGIINHTKKRQNSDHVPNTMDDIFGSRFFSAALSNAIVVWPTKIPNEIELHIVKSRFSPKPAEPLVVRRTANLQFLLNAKSFSALDVLVPKTATKELEPKEKKPSSLRLALGELAQFGSGFSFSLPDADGNPVEITPYSKDDDPIEGFEI